MKITVIAIFMLFAWKVQASNPYRTYLLLNAFNIQSKYSFGEHAATPVQLNVLLPRYEIPKGNIFCRLEDKLTRATKVWVKIGVQ